MKYLIFTIILCLLSSCEFMQYLQENPEDAKNIGKGITDTAGLIFGYPGKIVVGTIMSLILGGVAIKGAKNGTS